MRKENHGKYAELILQKMSEACVVKTATFYHIQHPEDLDLSSRKENLIPSKQMWLVMLAGVLWILCNFSRSDYKIWACRLFLLIIALFVKKLTTGFTDLKTI